MTLTHVACVGEELFKREPRGGRSKCGNEFYLKKNTHAQPSADAIASFHQNNSLSLSIAR